MNDDDNDMKNDGQRENHSQSKGNEDDEWKPTSFVRHHSKESWNKRAERQSLACCAPWEQMDKQVAGPVGRLVGELGRRTESNWSRQVDRKVCFGFYARR